MALFHFVNCSLTTFIPYYIIFDGFKLSKDVGSTKLFLIVCFYYIISQILKLFALAFFSIGLFQNMNLFNIIFQESANIIDLAGLYYILSHKHTNTINLKERILSVGLSWGFYDSLATNFFPFFIGGRSMDFSLKFIYRSILANTFLLSNLSKTCLLYIWLKNPIHKKKLTFVSSLLIYFTFILPLTNKIILLHEDSFNMKLSILMLFQIAISFFLSWVTKCLFSSHSNNSEQKKKEKNYEDDENRMKKEVIKEGKKKYRKKKN